MAAAPASLQDLCEESTCSICLEYFQDPVTIECGHNFCRGCLTQYWGGLGGKVVFCPQCRGKVQRKLIANRQMANFVELTKKLRLQEEKSPQENGGVCGKHQEPLKLFCKDDEIPICMVCDRAKEHRNHDVVPLEEAVQDYRDLICSHLEQLQKERADILVYKVKTEEKSQELFKQTKAEMKKMKKKFRELHSFLHKQEKLLQDHLEKVEKETAKKRDENLARLSEELSSIEGLIWEMEKKCQQPPSGLLQDVRSILQRCEKKETLQNHITFPSELNVTILEVCDRSSSLIGLMKQLKDSLSQPLKQRSTIRMIDSKWWAVPVNVTLDPDTAYPFLVLSQDCKTVTHGDKPQILPKNPQRFSYYPYVLGREAFIGGRHCWDVTVGKEGDWAVGVARMSIRRKDFIPMTTEDEVWAIQKYTSCEGRSEYKVFNSSYKAFPHLSEEDLRRIWVSLNWEEGKVAFYDRDTGSHLYTFSGVSFSEIVLPFFYVNKNASITVSP